MRLGKGLRSLAVAWLCTAAAAQGAHELLRQDYLKKRDDALAEAGQRHLRIGSWARDAGLVPQATAQFLRAVEVSENKNPGAQTVLAYMRGLGDAFWTRDRKKPPRALVAEYGKRAAAAELLTRKAHVKLAQLAAKAKQENAAKEHWLAVLKLGGALAQDVKGGWKVEGEPVPAELGEWLKEQSAALKGGARVFEPAGAKAPRLEGLVEQSDDVLAVRTDLGAAQVQRLFQLGSQLLPALQERLDGAPVRRLVLYVFAKQEDYAKYLGALGIGKLAYTAGLAEYGSFQTLVCAEGKGEQEIDALVLHELSHLYFFGTAPAVMPDWYAEGFAETFGGQGTFAFDGEKLELGKPLLRARLDDLKKQPMPIRDFLAGDAFALWAADRDKALRFYAQAWAFQRFVLQPDSPWRARFLQWEAACRGKALGAPEKLEPRVRQGDVTLSTNDFERLFAKDLDAIDAAFKAWLAAQ